MRTGAVTTGIADIELAEVIADASAIVDAYCNVPLLPQPHSFLGGTVVGEEHQWKYPEFVFDRGTRRVYLFHSPVTAVTAFTLRVAADVNATLPVDQFVVNHSEKWIEVTSLAIASNSGLFGVTGWIVPLGGLSHPMAVVDYTYGNITTVTAERVYQTAVAGATYQTSHGFWVVDGGHPLTVTANGVAVTPTSYDIESGRLTFSAAQADPVRVTYSYRLNRDIASATAHVTAFLLGSAKNQSKFGGGVSRIRVGEIDIDRRAPVKTVAEFLDQSVPEAALLLAGHRFWWMA